MTPHRPLLPVLAPCVGRTPPSAIGRALQTMAQALDPDQPPAGREIVLRIQYDAIGEEPAYWGEEYRIILLDKAPSPEARSRYVRQYFHAQLPPGGTP